MSVFLALVLCMMQEPETSGVHERLLNRESGPPVRYTLLIPSPYSRQEKYPLVVALHHAGRVTPFFGKGMLLHLVQPALRELSAIVAAPDSLGRGWDNPENEAAVLDIIAHLRKSYRIDERKILVTGYSMGGRGTWYLAARHPEIFSAAIPLAGSPPADLREMVDNLRKIPLYVIHSRDDEVVPLLPTEDAVRFVKGKGVRVELVVLSGVTHYQSARFVEPLRDSIPWIRRVWEARSGALPPPTPLHQSRHHLGSGQDLALADVDLLDSPAHRRPNLELHLHRFDYEDDLALVDLLALTDADLQNFPGHGRPHFARSGRGGERFSDMMSRAVEP